MGKAAKNLSGEIMSEPRGPFKQIEERGHELVTYFYSPRFGIKAIIAVHSSALGPALGGCRLRNYETEEQALEDVLRLSEGMTYKNAMAELALGGGKACIIADPHFKENRAEFFREFGRAVEALGGRYITAEDMGTGVEDIMNIGKVTKHVSGTSGGQRSSGDPSPYTARGVFLSIQAVCERVFGSRDLKGKKIAVQGVGHCGTYLTGHLVEAGAQVVVCDPNQLAVKQVKEKFGVSVVEPDKIYDVDCDIYSPAAIGQTVNKFTIPRLKAKIICGAANNQLPDSSVYSLLMERGITYCPDFIVNAGGVINAGSEVCCKTDDREAWVMAKVNNIYNTISLVLDQSKARGKFTEAIAVELAKERVRSAEDKRQS